MGGSVSWAVSVIVPKGVEALSLGSQSLLGEPGLLRGGSTRVVMQALPRAPRSGASASSPGEDEFVRQSPTFPDFFTFCDFLRDGPTFSIRHLQNRPKYLHTLIFYEKSESVFKTRATILFLAAWSTFVGKKHPRKHMSKNEDHRRQIHKILLSRLICLAKLL